MFAHLHIDSYCGGLQRRTIEINMFACTERDFHCIAHNNNQFVTPHKRILFEAPTVLTAKKKERRRYSLKSYYLLKPYYFV